MLLLIFPDTTCCWVHVPMQGHPRMLQSHVPHTWVSQGLGRLMPTAQSKDPGTAFGYFRLQAGLDLCSALSSLLGVAGAGCKARQAPGGTKALNCADSGGQQHSLDPLNMLCQGNQVSSSSFWVESRRAAGQTLLQMGCEQGRFVLQLSRVQDRNWKYSLFPPSQHRVPS